MNRKMIIVFIIGIAAGIGGTGLAFNRLSHGQAANSNQAIQQNQAATTPSNDTTNTSNAVAEKPTDTQNADQNTAQPDASADAATPPDQNQAQGQDQGTDADDQGQANDDAAAPAAQPIIVPAGTTLTVRLGESLGSSISAIGQKFSATLDQDVVVAGQTVIPAGSAVAGRVVLARPTGPLTGEATLQIKLTRVNVNNANVSVVTSTRSFGPKIKGKSKVRRFMKGLVKRAAGEEREVLLAEQTAYSFTLRQSLQIQ